MTARNENDRRPLPARRPVKGELGSAAERRTLDGPRASAGHHRAGVDFAAARSIDLASLLGRYGLLNSLRRQGRQLCGPCPICEVGERSFVVDLAKNVWRCFADCNAGGSSLEFVAARERLAVERAAVLVSQWFALSPAPSRAPATCRSNVMATRPSHYLWIVEERPGDEKPIWHRIAAVWPHRGGLTVHLPPGVSVSGRLLLREADERTAKTVDEQ